MTDYSDAAKAGIRLSNDDREKAVLQLARAHSDGRLTADEYTERSTAARAAVTRGDLAPLFADLPDPTEESVVASSVGSAPDPDFGPPAAAAASPAQSAASPTKPRDDVRSDYRGDPRGDDRDDPRDAYSRPRPLGGTAGVVAVSVTPFIVLVIFLILGFFTPHGWSWAWVFWLAVPIVGIIVYGPAGRRDRDRDRY
ncbi:DUF1707 domain-containing protein [Herbiconiux liukaitaii]|uniref:DUF1707 domain-containing protein n=1 Tax=Herbiconiux liukaitaii TaxID=3342799 RepID=UPI0035B83EE2